MEEEAFLKLSDVWQMIKKRHNFILITTLVITLATAYISYFIVKPTYEAEMSVFIGNNYEKSDDKSQIDSVTLYQKLMKTYVVIAKSSLVAEKTIEKLNIELSPEVLRDSISVLPEQDTQVLMISIRSKNPSDAVNIINAFGEAFMDEGKWLYPTGDIKIIDSAKFPTSPVSPDIKLNLIIAVLSGLMISICSTIIRELTDRTIRTEEDVERYINVPVIGSIFKEDKLGKSQSVSLSDPKSQEAEAYRTLRTNIEYSSIDKKIHTIVITSANTAEGKSTTASNLASIMAQAGKKTLLIDCDLRKPNIHKIFKISNSTGLSNFLAGEALMQEIISKGIQDNLYIVTSGIKPPNPAELLSSEKMKQFIGLVNERFDYIILDTPPVCLVTDAQILSQYADGCTLVVSSGETDRNLIMKAKELLLKVNSKLLGVVLNKVDGKNYYGYSVYSNSYYGSK